MFIIFIFKRVRMFRSSPMFFFKSVMSLSLSVSSLRLSLPTRTQSGLCSITRWDLCNNQKFHRKISSILRVISLFIIRAFQDVPIWSAIASAVWESSMVLNCHNVQLSQIESQLWRSGNPSEYRLRPKSKSSNWRQSELRLLEKKLLGFDFPPQRCNTSDVALWLN